jgi:hypothetical protein
MLIILLNIKGVLHKKKKIGLTGQTVNSAHFCDILRRLRENSRRKSWHDDNAPCHTSFLAGNNLSVVSRSTEGRHSGTAEATEAFAFSAYARKGEVRVASGPEASFWPDGSTTPGNHGWLFVENYSGIASN